MKKSDKHLPIFGVGPIFGAIVVISTIVFSALAYLNYLPSGNIKQKWLQIVFIVLGALISVYGLIIWILSALGKNSIDKYILKNELYTKGIYSVCRNPVYTGLTFVFIGLLLIARNYWLLTLPFVYWVVMTVMMKSTEEKWLIEKYGDAYIEYCKTVNRCIPWFPKKNK